MLKVSLHTIRPEKQAQLRAWFQELNARADEVRVSFERETVRAEAAYILQGSRGPILVYVVEAEDLERAQEAYAESTHWIDRQHREVMAECLAEPLDLEPVYEVSL